jgi:hypothetical protein
MDDFEKEYHVRCGDVSGDSFNTFGESFMMDSFANGESFASSSFCNYESNRYHQRRNVSSKLTDDMSSILIIEEECEDTHTLDEIGKHAKDMPTNHIRMNFSATPNTFSEMPCQDTHV